MSASWWPCCCGPTPGPCYCAGTALGLQVSFADWADTWISGLAAEINGTHVLSPLSASGTGQSPYVGSACYSIKEQASTTMDTEIGSYGSFCTDNCTGTSSDAGNFWRIYGFIGAYDSPQTQIGLDVWLVIHGYESRDTTGFSCDRLYVADSWHFSAVIDTANCADILETLTLGDVGRVDDPFFSGSGSLWPWQFSLRTPTSPCPNYQLDDTSASCELSIVT